MKAGNTLDTLITTADGRGTVRHYLQDVGSTFGTGANAPHDYDEGWEALFEGDLALKRLYHPGLLHSALADRRVCQESRDWPVRGRRVRSRRLEAARADRRIPAGASRRHVLGGAARDGVLRRDDPRGGQDRAVQRSCRPKRSWPDVLIQRRDKIGRRVSTGHQSGGRRRAERHRDADFRQRRGRRPASRQLRLADTSCSGLRFDNNTGVTTRSPGNLDVDRSRTIAGACGPALRAGGLHQGGDPRRAAARIRPGELPFPHTFGEPEAGSWSASSACRSRPPLNVKW